ncbi:MAG: WGR domain-containing protein [Alphaproteobacteria bacterium]|nr:WGR domain-containing protein [Alphaproteobacteria bacterium]MCB9696876.1 WGR domain-containing protein [Alphaproteobacteria bacterium]
MRRFELVDGKSSKFWEIELDGASFTVRYGRIGTNGQSQTKDFPTAAKASAEHDKLIKEKTGKGYSEIGGEEPEDADADEAEAEAVAADESETEAAVEAGGTRRFEYVDDKSSKFWEITVEGSGFTVRYGRIGANGQTQEKSFPTAAKAQAEADKLIAEKTGKGYAEVGGTPTAKPVAAAEPEASAEEAEAEETEAGGTRRFEYVDDKSSKFWEITVEGSGFTVRYGRIGASGQTQEKSFPTATKAQAEADKLIAEKTGKGYAEVGAAPAPKAAAPRPAAPAAPKAAAPPPKPKAPPPSTEGFLDAGNGYALGIVDGAIAARNAAGKVLASVPKQLKDTDAYEMLEGALELLATHAVECREDVEGWMLRSLPVPRAVLEAIWIDPDWQGPLQNVIVAGADTGILRAVEGGKGLGVVNLDGETVWLTDDIVSLPHPILLEELDDWRGLLTDLGASQGTAQLFRETFLRPEGDAAEKSSVDEFSDGSFDLLAQANNEARKLGYRVSGGCAVCRVWEGGVQTEARYYIGDGDPMYETSTGDLSWVDARQQSLKISQVGPVAFSEGMRMASAIYAKRKIEKQEDADA